MRPRDVFNQAPAATKSFLAERKRATFRPLVAIAALRAKHWGHKTPVEYRRGGLRGRRVQAVEGRFDRRY